MRQYQKKYRKRYKKQLTAKWKVDYAVKTGILVHPKQRICWECGKPASLYHHILGYKPQNWFDVIPLCLDCHFYVHRVISRRQVILSSEQNNPQEFQLVAL